MSDFDDASLVLIPSGYKNQKIYSVKPTDGTGDLTFTRASAATRVASNGLIEKVRTNFFLYSNTFSDAAWTKNNTTLTSGQADPFGGNNAWKFQSILAVQSDLRQTVAGAAGYSVYAKAGSYGFISLWTGTIGISFDLTNGTAGAGGKITSVGGGWYRCSVATSSTGSVTLIPYFSATAGDYVYIAFAQAEPTDVPTDYIATTSAAVSVGPVSGLPRLDYLNSSCPKLLLEPQRTNLVTFSENLDNAAWVKSTTTVTANAQVSPDGYTNAETMTVSTSASIVEQTMSLGAGTYTFSVYVKVISQTTAGQMRLQGLVDAANVSVNFTPTTEWQRFTATYTPTATLTSVRVRGQSFVGTLAVWGAQLEVGAYASSYIPTLGASVTRVADAASKTGISSLIGQTEGTFFLEFSALSNSVVNEQISLSDGTDNNTIKFVMGSVVGGVKAEGKVAGAGQFGITKSTSDYLSNKKIAVAYKANDFVFYYDGVLIGSDTSGSVPAMSVFNFAAGSGVFPSNINVKQILVFKTRLTNAQLASLTSL